LVLLHGERLVEGWPFSLSSAYSFAII